MWIVVILFCLFLTVRTDHSKDSNSSRVLPLPPFVCAITMCVCVFRVSMWSGLPPGLPLLLFQVTVESSCLI